MAPGRPSGACRSAGRLARADMPASENFRGAAGCRPHRLGTACGSGVCATCSGGRPLPARRASGACSGCVCACVLWSRVWHGGREALLSSSRWGSSGRHRDQICSLGQRDAVRWQALLHDAGLRGAGGGPSASEYQDNDVCLRLTPCAPWLLRHGPRKDRAAIPCAGG